MRPLKAIGSLALGLLAGCYSYRTIPIEDVRPDLDVRVRVRPEAAGHVATVMGYLTQDVNGRVVSLEQDTMLLTVATPTAPQSRRVQRLYQRLDLAVSQVIEVEQRSLDRGKTFAAVAVAVAGSAGVAVWAFSGPLGGSGGDRPPPIDNRLVAPRFLVPLGRIPLGR